MILKESIVRAPRDPTSFREWIVHGSPIDSPIQHISRKGEEVLPALEPRLPVLRAQHLREGIRLSPRVVPDHLPRRRFRYDPDRYREPCQQDERHDSRFNPAPRRDGSPDADAESGDDRVVDLDIPLLPHSGQPLTHQK